MLDDRRGAFRSHRSMVLRDASCIAGVLSEKQDVVLLSEIEAFCEEIRSLRFDESSMVLVAPGTYADSRVYELTHKFFPRGHPWYKLQETVVADEIKDFDRRMKTARSVYRNRTPGPRRRRGSK